MCLLEWFRKEHSWDHLMRLLSQLGSDSRWGKVRYNDPEIAEEMARQSLESKEPQKWRPRDLDWTLVNEQLGLLIDLQGQFIRMMSSTPNRTIEPFPRPETEFSKALARLKEERADAEMARIYGFVAEGQRRWREGHRPAEPS